MTTKNPFSAVLPDKLKIAIADVITGHGHLENQVVTFIWELKKLEGDKRKKTAKARASDNIEELQRTLEAVNFPLPDAVWLEMHKVRDERNLVGHGAWGVFNGVPCVVWRSRILGEARDVGAKPFSYERFAALNAMIKSLLTILLLKQDAIRAASLR